MVCSTYFVLSVGMVDDDVEELQDVSNQVHHQHHEVWFEKTIGHPQGAAGQVQAISRELQGDSRISFHSSTAFEPEGSETPTYPRCNHTEDVIGENRRSNNTYPLQANQLLLLGMMLAATLTIIFTIKIQPVFHSLNQGSYEGEMGDHTHTLASMDLAAYQTARAGVCICI